MKYFTVNPKKFGVCMTLLLLCIASALAYLLWSHFMTNPWTRDGRVRADIIKITPDVSGEIVQVYVQDNQAVTQGQPLFKVDDSHYKIALKSAQAALAAAQIDFKMKQENAQRLTDHTHLIASQEAQQNAQHMAQIAQAHYQTAKAALAEAKLNLQRTIVSAPTDGYVTNLNAFVGNYVSQGRAVLAIVAQHSFYVYGYFEETKIPKIKLGANATIRLMNGTQLQGTVVGIAHAIADQDSNNSNNLVVNVNPVFSWVRLAQRIPVRIQINPTTLSSPLIAGETCTVIVH